MILLRGRPPERKTVSDQIRDLFESVKADGSRGAGFKRKSHRARENFLLRELRHIFFSIFFYILFFTEQENPPVTI